MRVINYLAECKQKKLLCLFNYNMYTYTTCFCLTVFVNWNLVYKPYNYNYNHVKEKVYPIIFINVAIKAF